MIKMSYYVYWCTRCGKSFSEILYPITLDGYVLLNCDECGGEIDHDERDD